MALGIVEELSGAFAGARGLVSSILNLFTLEARRAGLTLALMLACGVIGAILVAAAWLGLMSVVALWVFALGAGWEAAAAVFALGNLAAAAGLFWLCGRMSRDLLFPATQRQLRQNSLEPV